MRTRELMTRQADCFHHDVLPALEKEGIEIARWDDLDDAEHVRLWELFGERIFPVLTPLAVDPAHPFPYISGLSLNLAVVVRNPRTATEHFARVKVPPNFPRFLPVAEQRFVRLEDVIAAHLAQLFPGMEVLQHHTFRVTRNEDVEVEEDDAENLLTAMERELMRQLRSHPNDTPTSSASPRTGRAVTRMAKRCRVAQWKWDGNWPMRPELSRSAMARMWRCTCS